MFSNRILSICLALAIAGCGSGGGSSAAPAPTAPVPQPQPGTVPDAPANVQVAAGDSELTITWDAATGATSYNLYMDTASGVTKFTTSGSGFMKHTGVTSPYVHTGLTNGTTYYVVVTAVNSAGEGLHSLEASGAPVASTSSVTWTKLTLPRTSKIIALTLDPGNPSTVYGAFKDLQSGETGVYKTTDGGGTWSIPYVAGATSGDITALALDPATPTNIIMGKVGLLESNDEGGSWGPVPSSTITSSHSFLTIAFSPGGTYAGGGSVYRRLGGNWFNRSTGLPSTTRAIAVHPDPFQDTAWVGTGFGQPDGVYKTTDGGLSWVPPATSGGGPKEVWTLAINNTTPTILYAGGEDDLGTLSPTGDAIWKSTNGGTSWSKLTSSPSASATWTLAIDPNTPDTVWAGTWGHGVFRTKDGGQTWSAVNSGLTNLTVLSLAVDPISGAVYAGTEDGIFKTQ